MAGRKRIGPDLIDMIATRFLAPKQLSCLVEGLGIEA